MKIFVLPLFVVLFGSALAYDPSDLDRLLQQRYCYGCDLAGADFAGEDLSGVDLTGSDLQFANFNGAILNDAVLAGANLSGATWTDGRICQEGSIGYCR